MLNIGINLENKIHQPQSDLETSQKDYAVYLPAISSFFSGYIGNQRHNTKSAILPGRIPTLFNNGVEGLNWWNKKEGYFYYKSSLYSAGHAELDVNKHSPKEDMIRNRDRNNSWLLCDSGGFQIGKGVWEGDWKNINCPKAAFKRQQVLSWMDAYGDYGMTLDVPAWVCRTEAGKKATGINSYKEAVDATLINNEYFMKNRNGNCKFLNVLQGENHTQADDWYQQMKKFCDPKKYEQPFNGWAMGGQNMCDPHLVLRRLVTLRHEGLLEPGIHDRMHFLGTSQLEWAVLLTDIQRSIRKHHNPNMTLTYDCASPFLATANGQIYYEIATHNKSKWSYRMAFGADDKKYSLDQRSLKAAFEQDKIFKHFEESPISARLKISDICYYQPGQVNKINKVGKTSWDSFSYTLQMAHNVWMHIEAVQRANRTYDSGIYPRTLMTISANKKNTLYYDRMYFRDIVDDIFATSDYGKAMQLIEHYNKYWMSIGGTRGNFSGKAVNSQTHFNKLFE